MDTTSRAPIAVGNATGACPRTVPGDRECPAVVPAGFGQTRVVKTFVEEHAICLVDRAGRRRHDRQGRQGDYTHCGTARRTLRALRFGSRSALGGAGKRAALGRERLTLDRLLGGAPTSRSFHRLPRTRRCQLSPSGASSVEMEEAAVRHEQARNYLVAVFRAVSGLREEATEPSTLDAASLLLLDS